MWFFCKFNIPQSAMVPPSSGEFIINVSIELPFIFCGDPIGVDDIDNLYMAIIGGKMHRFTIMGTITRGPCRRDANVAE